MIIIALGINYVTQVFSWIKDSVDFGFDALQKLLDAIGLPWEIYMLVLVGFFVVYILIGFVMDNFRGSADSILSDYAQLQRRQARKEAFDRRTQTMNENYKAINNTMKEVLKRTRKP